MKKHWWSCTRTNGNEGSTVCSQMILRLAQETTLPVLLFLHLLPSGVLKLEHASQLSRGHVMQSAGPLLQGFWFRRSENLHFQQLSRKRWCHWSCNHLWRTTALHAWLIIMTSGLSSEKHSGHYIITPGQCFITLAKWGTKTLLLSREEARL